MHRQFTATAAILAAALLAAGCAAPSADRADSKVPSTRQLPFLTQKVTVNRTAWFAGEAYRVTDLTVTAQPDGRNQVTLVVQATTGFPFSVIGDQPHLSLEADGLAVADLGKPMMSGSGGMTTTTTFKAKDVGLDGKPLDADGLTLVLTAPGLVRAVIPLGAPQPGVTELLEPIALKPSAATLETGRYRLAQAAAQLRQDCTGSPDAVHQLGGSSPDGIDHGSRALDALKPGQHSVVVWFDAPPGTTPDGLDLHLTLPDGRRIAPSTPPVVLDYQGRHDAVNLSAWFDFYGGTTGVYTLEAADRGAPPATLTLHEAPTDGGSPTQAPV
ncbi:hypothetical protein AB0K51_11230 [Kitasatospora sp. NPDC049285]|uniref:hypothetical protein n=1 Tax=Kitasatospora sp. NPDC049285 TaxID=3157096 RepID=UPI0034160FFD